MTLIERLNEHAKEHHHHARPSLVGEAAIALDKAAKALEYANGELAFLRYETPLIDAALAAIKAER